MAISEHTDLPERFGPMTVKELRQSLRRTSFVYPFICIHLFATVAIYAEFQLGVSPGGGGMPAVFAWDVDNIGLFWWVAMGACGILMPLAGFLLMPQEIEEGNHELLLLTTLSRWQVVFGKFLMLWGLSLLTFTSLLPYIIIRYFIGGIEWFHELANAGSVICVAAIIASGAIAASGFNHVAAKLGIFALYLWFAILGGGAALMGGIMSMNMSLTTKWVLAGNFHYHASVIITTACICIIGMLIARSRLRLATMNFELKPSTVLLVVTGLAPFIIGMAAAFTCGFGSIVGILLLTYLAWNSDVTPKAPKSMPPPPPNTPEPPPLPEPND
ncbi:MAG: hypothetical protein NWR03_05670 [Akkermansiaceae bacterium]|nr:hypothetical protein [Akkermansiaceae bacterium]MDP4897249.1 hypothetical protein [Akkermansiaceae bacterium]MDP4996275.1 hypothetical protein [Akkermansiaceae bacterium]